MISSISLALTLSVNQMMKTAFSWDNEDKQSPNDLIPIDHLLMAEAINDPKPNKLARS